MGRSHTSDLLLQLWHIHVMEYYAAFKNVLSNPKLILEKIKVQNSVHKMVPRVNRKEYIYASTGIKHFWKESHTKYWGMR